MSLLSETAPAKVNLSLHVGPPKDNGRHDLVSLVTFADDAAADKLTARASTHFSLAVDGPYADQSGPARDNLILQAARAMDTALSGDAPKLAFRLEKHLPCAAGIGGGSADAGAALRLIARAHGGETALIAAKEVSPRLGGDVLACLIGSPGLMAGEGEIFTPLPNLPHIPAILVNSRHICPTPAVFKAYDNNPPTDIPDHPTGTPQRTPLEDLIDWIARETTNSLQEAAQRVTPWVERVLRTLESVPDTRLIRMSGSGETCYALFSSMEQAERGAKIVRAAEPDWWVRATLLGAG
ncbi:MAG: 4-(cytidine 5'-diphospho)-2-C-methyl-D-erythritol kinase [Pseudomonadota bacterium]